MMCCGSTAHYISEMSPNSHLPSPRGPSTAIQGPWRPRTPHDTDPATERLIPDPTAGGQEPAPG